MPEPFLYEAEPEAFLRRANRTQALMTELTSGEQVDIKDWSARMRAVLAEVPPLPLVLGVTYRFKTVGGEPKFKHYHYEDSAGKTAGIDLPYTSADYVELQGVFRGRNAGGPWKDLIWLVLADGRSSFLSDGDVLRCEEIR